MVRTWLPYMLMVGLLIIINVIVVGVIEWTNNSQGGRIGVTVIGIAVTVGVYIQQYYYARWLILGTVKGWLSVAVFAFGILSITHVHAVIFFIMALYGEPFGPVAQIPPVSEAFHYFYLGPLPLTIGVFVTAGNAFYIARGVASNLWWAWTALVGVIHMYFIVGFFMSRLIAFWSNGQTQPLSVNLDVFPTKKEHPFITRRKNRAPSKKGLHVYSLGKIKQ